MKVNSLSYSLPQSLNRERALKEGEEGLESVFFQILLSALLLGLGKNCEDLTLNDMGKNEKSDLLSISLKKGEHTRKEFFNDLDLNMDKLLYQMGIKEETYKENFFQEFSKEVREVLSNGFILENKNLNVKIPLFTDYFAVNKNGLEKALAGNEKTDKMDEERGSSFPVDRLLEDLLKVSEQGQKQNHRISQDFSEVIKEVPFEQASIREEMRQFLEKFLKREEIEVKDTEFRLVRNFLQENENLRNLMRFMERILDRTQVSSVDEVYKIDLSLRNEKDLDRGLKVFVQQPVGVSYFKSSYSVYKNIDSVNDDQDRSAEDLFKTEKEETELIDQSRFIRSFDKKVEKGQILVFEDIFHESLTEAGLKRIEYVEILRLRDEEKISHKFLDFIKDLVIEARSSGEKRALLRLEPPELGTLELEIKVIHREVTLSIRADNPETLKQMQAGLEQIKQSLQEVGLNLREFQTQLHLGFTYADLNTERGFKRNQANGEESSEILRKEDIEGINHKFRNYKGRYYFVV